MTGFILELAYALERLAKRANRDANETYAQVLEGGYRIDGGRVVPRLNEDDALAECRRTGKWCDEWDDAISELEDAWAITGARAA